jgi:hypothetical protein
MADAVELFCFHDAKSVSKRGIIAPRVSHPSLFLLFDGSLADHASKMGKNAGVH